MLGINYELQYRSGPREEGHGSHRATGNDGQQWPPCHTGSTCLHFRFRALCQLAGKHTHARSHTRTHARRHTDTHMGIFSHSNKAINCYYIEKYTRTHAYTYIYTHTVAHTQLNKQTCFILLLIIWGRCKYELQQRKKVMNALEHTAAQTHIQRDIHTHTHTLPLCVCIEIGQGGQRVSGHSNHATQLLQLVRFAFPVSTERKGIRVSKSIRDIYFYLNSL